MSWQAGLPNSPLCKVHQILAMERSSRVWQQMLSEQKKSRALGRFRLTTVDRKTAAQYWKVMPPKAPKKVVSMKAAVS
jgi:hypothetical protein